jgi:drug/metabolite transporter (DMT)-like permease
VRKRPEIPALISVAFFFGSNSVAGRLVLAHLTPSVLLIARVVGAALVFAALYWARGFRRIGSRRDAAALVLCAIFGVALNQFLYLTGLSHSSAIHATVIGTSIPVFTAAIAMAVRQERMSWRKIGGIGLAISGALTVANLTSFRLKDVSFGDLFFVANSLSYAGYLVLSRELLRRIDVLTLSFWSFLFGAAMVLPLGLGELGPMLARPPPIWVWAVVAYMVIGPTVLAYFLNSFGMRRVGSLTAATYVYLQPLFAVALAVPLLGERPTASTGLGALLIFAGVMLSTWRPEEQSFPEPSSKLAAPPQR